MSAGSAVVCRGDHLLTLPPRQEIGYTHMRVAQGETTLVQMSALLARLCRVAQRPAN